MLYFFGGFELSEEEFSLRRAGKRLPLEPRALHVLLVLAASEGRLLDKKALLEAVWKDTFVEETTLTRAIALIRKQLEDDPKAPKFIETVPTRGYRFIAAVEVRPSRPSGQHAIASPSAPASFVDSPSAPVTPEPEIVTATSAVNMEGVGERPTVLLPITDAGRAEPKARRGWVAGLLLGTLAACVVAGVLFFVHMRRSHAAQALSVRDVLVLGDFANSSGEPVFDGALRQGMLVQLEQSPVVRLVSDGQIRRTLKLMDLKSDTVVTPEIGLEICQRVGGTVVLDGSITKLGDEYVLGLRAWRCGTGEELDAEQVQFQRKEEALNALSGISTRFRTRIGEASASIHELDTPLAEATTSSLEALKAYSLGIRAFNTQGSKAGAALFQRATELDPKFAAAHVWLGRMYADLGQESLAVASTERAHALRERASDRERFLIDVSYETLVTGNLEKARAVCDAWTQVYGRDVYARAFRAGVIDPAYGRYEHGLQESKETIAIDPDFVIGYRNAALNLIALDRVDEAEGALRQAAQRKVYLPSFVTDSYRIAFLRKDDAAMKKALETAPENPWLQYYQATTLARSGRMTEATAVQDQAVRLSRRGGRREMEAQLQVSAALTDVLYGYRKEAVAKVHSALPLSQGRLVQASAALVLALAGYADEAGRIAADLRKRFPEDTLLQHDYLPAVEAAMALAQKQPQRALQVLDEASQFELSLPLYPVYLRGEAYLALGKGALAAAEFHKIVDHPGLVMNDPLGNLAQINLGRAYRMAGERERAQAAFQALEGHLERAEESFPVLAQMKQESIQQ